MFCLGCGRIGAEVLSVCPVVDWCSGGYRIFPKCVVLHGEGEIFLTFFREQILLIFISLIKDDSNSILDEYTYIITIGYINVLLYNLLMHIHIWVTWIDFFIWSTNFASTWCHPQICCGVRVAHLFSFFVLSYYDSLCFEFRVVMSATISK